MQSRHPAQEQGGFTLIELLVAITILAIVAVLGWRGLDGIVRARVTLNAELAQTRGTQLSFAQLENDCEHLASPELLPQRETLHATPQRLLMIRTVFEEGFPSQVQVVAYKLQDGVLSRRESAPTRDLQVLDAMWQSALNGVDSMPMVNLQSGVESFQMRTWTFEDNAWRVASDSVNVPSGDGKTVAIVPKRGLEVSLQLRGQERPLLKVFLLGAV
jgi:general secretion pathway protein J